jgi:hypothetical protein
MMTEFDMEAELRAMLGQADRGEADRLCDVDGLFAQHCSYCGRLRHDRGPVVCLACGDYN